MKQALYLLSIIGILLSVAGCRAGGDADKLLSGMAGTPPTLDPQSVEQGEVVYVLHCAVCHGAALEGEAEWKLQNADGSFRAPPHNADGHTWHHSDAQLIEAIRLGGDRLPADIGGSSTMPAYETILTADDIIAVLDYIKSTWPEEIRDVQWQRTTQTQQ